MNTTELCKECNIARSTLYYWHKWEEANKGAINAPKLPKPSGTDELGKGFYEYEAIEQLKTFQTWVKANRGIMSEITKMRRGVK